jgi:hypothetical protein
MGARYTVSKVGTAISTTADSMTITAPANRSLKIWDVIIGGQAVASAANEITIIRSTGGATPVAITPTPLNPDYASALFTAAGSWTTQPTPGAVIRRIPCNGNGGVMRTPYPPGNEIDVPAGTQISVRAAAGSSLMTIELTVEQI